MLSDLYLPGFPQIADHFGVSPTDVQLSLTTAMAGVAVGQLTFGPLSDRFGRRAILIVGLSVGIVASVAVALAPTLPLVVAARFVQGFGIASGLAISRAIASDVTTGVGTMRWLGIISVVAGIGALIAPVLGGLLLTVIGWRAPLWALAMYVAIVLALVLGLVPESHPPDRRRRGGAIPARGTGLVSIPFLGYALSLAFGFGAFVAFVSASPFIYQEVIGWTGLQFGIVYAAHALLMAASTLVSTRIANRIPMRSLLGIGLGAILFAGVCALLIAILGAPSVLYPVPLAFVSVGIGIVIPSSMALALGQAAHAAGRGSALLGFLQFTVASIAAPMVSLGPAPLLTFGIVLAGFAGTAMLCFLTVVVADRRRSGASKGPQAAGHR
jgi:DHA1 family bicyclomycin/chloramphenicol resistance-like MFS transporter